MTEASADSRGHRLLQLGVLLFLVGLLTGFAVTAFADSKGPSVLSVLLVTLSLAIVAAAGLTLWGLRRVPG